MSPFKQATAMIGIAATLATVLATLAGVFLGFRKLSEDRNTFQLQILKEQTAQKQAAENTAIAEEKRATNNLEQVRIQQRIVELQLESEREKFLGEQHERDSDRLTVASQRLGEAIRHFQVDGTEAEAEIPIIAEYIGDESVNETAGLEALESRLEAPRSASEVRSIVRILPNAGKRAFLIEINANRKAFREANEVISSEIAWRLTHLQSDFPCQSVPSEIGNEIMHERPLSKEARKDIDLFPTSVFLICWRH